MIYVEIRKRINSESVFRKAHSDMGEISEIHEIGEIRTFV
jgi:hypothetical protein